MIRVLLVDDQELVRSGLRMVLDAQDGLVVVDEAGDGQAAVERVRAGGVDVVVMDVRMPRLDGVGATERIAALPDPPRVLLLTTFDLDEYAFAGLRAGAAGFLLKDVPTTELVSAIRAVHEGDAVVAPSTTRRLLDRFLPHLPGSQAAEDVFAELTAREREVLVLLAKGLSNLEISEALFLSEGTVKTHVSRVLTKLGVRDRVQAVVLAYQSGLVGLER
ncbi:response regulator [Cryptosporangium sp. NPDC048952]|uniref:response regulator n=1 Tax=Cryptosporangium sp. NPDC048952 TaxID=3363961 RepID=UPI0037236400